MSALEQVIEQAKRLPPGEQRRLVEAIEHDLSGGVDAPETPEQEERRLAALDRFLAMAGSARSDFTDVSGNTHKHLAEIYADNHLPADRK